MKTLLLYLSYLTTATASPVAIPAASTKGIPIGHYKDGDVVSVRYKSGQWSRRIQNPPENPDTANWRELRVVVYWEGFDGRRELVAQLYRTWDDPHRIIIKRPGNYFIRMAEPRESGVGVVLYDVGRKLIITK